MAMSVVDEILRLKREKRAIILSHNYQRPEIQDIADYVGDSIELCKRAMEEQNAKIIVFSAVDFMAESATILNPDKRVLLPSLGARCPMAQMLPVEEVRLWKRKHPKVPVVLYVNTLAEAKAECDVCCTSANAAKVVNSLDSDTVLFGPDHNLAWHVQQKTGKKVIPIPRRGFCPTHLLFAEGDILLLREEHPDAVVAVHPECIPEVQSLADFVGSTSQICRYARGSSAIKYIIATEIGIIHRLKKENPGKDFLPAYEGAVCPNMKLNTLERVHLSLKEEKYPVTVPKPVAKKARKALERMYSLVP
ncbi:MAG: Quinolinate synthase A [Candidatus Bathyarchaeota archaeon BA1]|nr:MAG: Quinolinate synthase A [Candidatus Bathyarchaeota archaeon BA1]